MMSLRFKNRHHQNVRSRREADIRWFEQHMSASRSGHRRCARIHQMHRAIEALQVLHRAIAEGALSVGAADDGDAAVSDQSSEIIPGIGRQARGEIQSVCRGHGN
jgi:hypothetical protein